MGLFDEMLQKRESRILIIDERFADRLEGDGRKIISLAAVEQTKSLDSISEFIIRLRDFGANRETCLVAVGGGIVQDVAAFVASIFMRGVNWKYYPTTLLAMADSCIGGKSSINVGPYKNLVGNFHPPSSIWIDPTLISTLNREALASGLIEAVKICYCRGDRAFSDYMSLAPSCSLSPHQAETIVKHSIQAKKWFIETDEFDRAERLLLNFGHTFGHAIEGASHFRISHGIAVALGILCAIELGKRTGRTYASDCRIWTLENHLRRLLSTLSLHKETQALSMTEILDRFAADKKHGTDWFTVIIPAESGEIEEARLPKDSSSLSAIRASIIEVLESISSQSEMGNGI